MNNPVYVWVQYPPPPYLFSYSIPIIYYKGVMWELGVFNGTWFLWMNIWSIKIIATRERL